jgi:uncharacterized membrane protein (UPF0127 family)
MNRSSFFPARLLVRNATCGTVLGTTVEIADSSRTRTRGLLGRKVLAAGEGLWIVPCESVHTFFMKFPIDLVYLDRRNRVRKVRSAVGPWKISVCFSAHSILELPAGTVLATQTKKWDKLEFVKDASQDLKDSVG